MHVKHNLHYCRRIFTMKHFEKLIKEKYNKLSPGQKKVAEYLIHKLDESAFNTAAQIGRKVEVSETTVIRLSYVLGFNGFSEMQASIQQRMLNHNHNSFSSGTQDVNDDKGPRSLFVETLEHHISSLHQALHQLNEAELWRVIQSLIDADRVLIVGMRASYAAAQWFSFQLHTLRDHVSLCETTGEIYEQLGDLTERSVVFVISLPRYSKATLHIAECVKSQGIPLICLTDRLLSPIGRIADLTLTTEENVEATAPSITPVISLLDLIIAGISMKDRQRVQARQQQLEELYSKYGVFVE
jgi:DNA-binding MurR/RpiR family transcriptional regulator